jgi:hypothetical protein
MSDKRQSSMDTQPFWADEQERFQSPIFPLAAIKGILAIYGIISTIIIFTLMFVLLYKLIHPILAWLWLLFIAVSLASGFYRRKRYRSLQQKITSIQENAKSKTGAVEIGSVIHVAGHPLLDREQQVVLALVAGKGLCFYKYDSDQPIDVVPLEDIISIFTVMYDDERTPHIEAVDSTAQALQIVFRRERKEFTTLLRSMKNLRPIDWYHALQKSRMQ